jgi:Holliday junction resolvase RusA-like endonuclease
MADYLAGKKQHYATVHKSPQAEAYKEEALWRLRCPGESWHAWQEPLLVRAIREDLGLLLDLDVWEIFGNDKSDADNRLKDLQDILAAHLEIDDRRIINPAAHKLVRPGQEPHVIVRLRIALPYNGEMERIADLLEHLENERVGVYDQRIADTGTVPIVARSARRR